MERLLNKLLDLRIFRSFKVKTTPRWIILLLDMLIVMGCFIATVVADIYSKGSTIPTPTILLNAHLDTVKPVAGWQHDPFTPTLEGDKLYGLGSNDCGGGLVSLLMTYIELQPTNIIFLASCEEEVSGKNGIESVLPLLPKIDFAIVGEPTGMQPAIAEKCLMVIDGYA